MPYQTIEDLPSRIQNILPVHAQEIYKSSFNSAMDYYDDEVKAHMVAWSSVQRQFEKDNGVWVKCNGICKKNR